MFKALAKALGFGKNTVQAGTSQSIGCGNVSGGDQVIQISGVSQAGNPGSNNVSKGSQRICIEDLSTTVVTQDDSRKSSALKRTPLYVGESFDKIDQAGSFDVKWERANELSIVIEAEEHLLPFLDVFVRAGTLVVTAKPGSFTASHRIVIYAKSPYLTSAKTTGSGDIEVVGVRAVDLEVTIAGSGDIEVTGKTSRLNVKVAGSGDFKGRGLTTDTAQLKVAGSGDISATVQRAVHAEVFGSGDIVIRGNPATRNTRVRGLGAILFK